jgi:hypothetical protein
MRILFPIFLMMLFAKSGDGQEQNWIDRLKSTPVVRMESGLPEKPFDQWLAELTKTQPAYEQSTCPAELDSPAVPCVIVSAELAPVRKLELMFAIPQKKAAKAGDAPICSFLTGRIGPSDPRSKQPTRLLRTLKDVEALLK